MVNDKGTNAILLLLDLSAAFDTVNHELLLKRLKNSYGIGGTVLSWLESYLSGRSFRVHVRDSKSSSCNLRIGVPQGSILGPLLFILYTKDLQEIAQKYGLSIHLYADDTQIYMAFDVHSKNPDLSNLVSCINEIRSWMSLNFLKLNEDKTEIMDIGMYQSVLKEIKLWSEIIEPVLKAKNLGFYFDHRLSLDEQIKCVQKVCNINLHNLWQIGSKLSYDLKIQLVHSCILSILDYCNCTYGALSAINLRKLQKLQNDSVRFIFNIRGKSRRKSISPFAKKLHFLPVQYRIWFKIALTVFKCINNLAPEYLKSLVTLRTPSEFGQ